MTDKKAPKRAAKRPKPKVQADVVWLEDRIKAAGFNSERELMRHMGMASGALTRRKKGQTAWGVEEIAVWAKTLKVSFIELARKVGYKIEEPQTPVSGVVRHDARVVFATKHRDSTVQAISSDLAVRALLFDVSEGPLRVYAGCALHYKPATGVQADALGSLAVVEVEGQIAPVVGTLERQGRSLRLVLLGAGETIEAPHVLTAAPVLGIVKA